MGAAGAAAVKSDLLNFNDGNDFWQLQAGVTNVGLGGGNVNTADQQKNSMILALRSGVAQQQLLESIGSVDGALVANAAVNVMNERVVPQLAQVPPELSHEIYARIKTQMHPGSELRAALQHVPAGAGVPLANHNPLSALSVPALFSLPGQEAPKRPLGDLLAILIKALYVDIRTKCDSAGQVLLPASQCTLVLTHPLRWDEPAKQLLIAAAVCAGFARENIKLVYEPSAAVMGGVSRLPSELGDGERLVLLDIGSE